MWQWLSNCHSVGICLTAYCTASFLCWTGHSEKHCHSCVFGEKEWTREKRFSVYYPFSTLLLVLPFLLLLVLPFLLLLFLSSPCPFSSTSFSFYLCPFLSTSFSVSLSLLKHPPFLSWEDTGVIYPYLCGAAVLRWRQASHLCFQLPSSDILQPWNWIFISRPKLFLSSYGTNESNRF